MAERTFTFSNGIEVRIKKLSQFLIMRLTKDNTEKFEVPQKLVKVGTRQTEKLIPDYDNPVYVELLKEQRERDLSDTLASLASYAVIDEVPDEEYDFYYDMAVTTKGNGVEDSFIKSLWLFDQIDTVEELEAFQNAIVGLTLPTSEGVEESEKKFQSES